MNVDTMRRIDRLAGVPLCAVATVLVRLRDLLRGRAERPARRILFVELSEMGSTVLASPAMRKAKAQLNAELYFVIFTRNVASLQLHERCGFRQVGYLRAVAFRFGEWTDTVIVQRAIGPEM